MLIIYIVVMLAQTRLGKSIFSAVPTLLTREYLTHYHHGYPRAGTEQRAIRGALA